MAVIVVFLLLAMTLGLSYAAVRSQSVAATIHRNAQRRGSARQAAITGLTMALRKMHNSSWAGVDSTFSGRLSDYETFNVTYTAGDPRLTSASPDYADLPFRVTLVSTGYAADPDNPQCIATHKARAIVKLIPRALSTEPADWNEITASTLYQWTPGVVDLNPPCRIEGKVRVQGTLRIDSEMKWDKSLFDSERRRYSGDLNARRSAGFADWRPFNDRVSFYYDWQYADTTSLLNSTLGIPTTNVWPKTATYWTGAVSNPTYKLYPGGPTYSVPTIGDKLEKISCGPDPLTNPLGVLYRNGKIDVNSDVDVTGTLLMERNAEGDLNIKGQRIRFSAVSLPALYGASGAVQLPAIVCGDTCLVEKDVDAAINGQVICYSDVNIAKGPQANISFAIVGALVTGNLYIQGRDQWLQTLGWWDDRLAEFLFQRGLLGGIAYFPDWLASARALSSQPRITIKPPSSPVRYHWHTLPNPVYVPAAGDAGLRWDILDWTEKL